VNQWNAEIIAVGSELLTPTKLDTNSLWLTDQLNTLGVEVVRKCVVGDSRADLSEAVGGAVRRAQIVIVTGGLGPTEDDVTRDAVADALQRGQVFRQDISDAIAARFARMNRPMVEINKRQAYLIEGAEMLPNGRGTAPGQWIDAQERVVMLLPGPPRELKAMFEEQCLPRLTAMLPPAVIRTRFYRVSCMPESDLDQLISPVYTQYTNPATTILAAAGDIQIHLRARCTSAEEAETLLAEVCPKIEALVGDRIYTCAGESLEAVVGNLLRERGATVAVAESASGGLLAERLTSIPGSSDYFRGGFLTYTDDVKISLLGVDADALRSESAVSEIVAKQMAEGARARLGTTWGVSVTGYAGPSGGDERNPVGTIYVGIAGPSSTRAWRLNFAGDRARNRQMSVVWALDLLRRAIRS
jgi:nicotinamide-nucleotide amidase